METLDPPPIHASSPSPIPSTIFHLQVETEVLLLLKEVIHNEFAHKVGIECVVDDFSASKLQGGMGRGPQGQAGRESKHWARSPSVLAPVAMEAIPLLAPGESSSI